jgi:hypothetical protein
VVLRKLCEVTFRSLVAKVLEWKDLFLDKISEL